MGFTSLQWNIRSILKKWHEFKNYLSTLDVVPDVLCIQEPHLTPNTSHHHRVICKIRPPCKGKGDGLMVCVKTSLDFSKVNASLSGNSNLEVIGISVHGFSIFNIYNSPSHHLTSASLSYPTSQKWFSVEILTLTTGCGEASTQTVVAGFR